MCGFIALGKKINNKEKQHEQQTAEQKAKKMNTERPGGWVLSGQDSQRAVGAAGTAGSRIGTHFCSHLPLPPIAPPHTPSAYWRNPFLPSYLAVPTLSPQPCWLPGSLRRGCVTVSKQQPCAQRARPVDQTCLSFTSMEIHSLCPPGKTKKTQERKWNPPAFAALQYSVQVLVK